MCDHNLIDNGYILPEIIANAIFGNGSEILEIPLLG